MGTTSFFTTHTRMSAPITHIPVANKAEAQAVAFAALQAKGPLVEFPFNHPEIGAQEVRVSVTHSGICHSDIHKIDCDWGESSFPLVCGHEVIGQVTAVGSEVTDFTVGDRVGFGPQRDHCENCVACEDGCESSCHQAPYKWLYDPFFGGYATSIQAPAKWCFKIPADLPSEFAAPLMCAGVTTFAPLQRHVKAGQTVGVVGIGGLGHLGLQYARAMGCRVVAISTSASKEAEARSLGATDFLISSDKEAMKKAASSLHFILNCGTGTMNISDYLPLLRPRGKMCIVGLPPSSNPFVITPFALIDGEREVVGSVVGSRQAMRDMLAFSAAHNIRPMIEIAPFSQAEEAVQRVRKGLPRYRMVLDVTSYNKN
eukprot:GILI01001213.1.p1 GENE.GILI01001213.1~~GILI01001213.1.p1  ORF type:complete len:371 (+),score=116.93 GILI01001213.1:346-1458(+)